jgi:hypothetical protein
MVIQSGAFALNMVNTVQGILGLLLMSMIGAVLFSLMLFLIDAESLHGRSNPEPWERNLLMAQRGKIAFWCMVFFFITLFMFVISLFIR